MIAFIVEWFMLIVAVFCIFPAYYYFDTKWFVGSNFFSAVSIGLGIWFFWPSISPLIEANGLMMTISSVTIVYIVAGLIVAPIYFVVYTWGVKDRYLEKLKHTQENWIINTSSVDFNNVVIQNEELKTAFVKYRTIKDHNDYIFDTAGVLKIFIDNVHFENDEAKFIAECEKVVNGVLPPKFSDIKPFIINAGVNWPITLFWILTSKIINQIIDLITSMFGGMYNMLSKLAFGKF